MRFMVPIAGVFAVLGLSGCATSAHDMLYYPPVDQRQASAAPPGESPPPPMVPAPEETSAPPPATVRIPQEPDAQAAQRVAALPPQPLPEGSQPALPLSETDTTGPAPAAESAPAPEPAPPAIALGPPPATDTHCRAVATQRASDAIANGYDSSMRDTIYRGTYADCMSWTMR